MKYEKIVEYSNTKFRRITIYRGIKWGEDTLIRDGTFYCGKKKRHTLKTQLLVSLQTGAIIALAFSNGK